MKPFLFSQILNMHRWRIIRRQDKLEELFIRTARTTVGTLLGDVCVKFEPEWRHVPATYKGDVMLNGMSAQEQRGSFTGTSLTLSAFRCV